MIVCESFSIDLNWLLEPGYYEDGSFGIRLENVLIVNEADTKFNFGSKGYLSFEHITWVSRKLCIRLSILHLCVDFHGVSV